MSGSTIRSAASSTSGRAEAVQRVIGQVDRETKAALAGVDGEIETPLHDASRVPATQGNAVMATATFCAGCLNAFGDAVDVYDHTSPSPRNVDALNQALSDARDNNYGMKDPEIPPNANQTQRAQIEGAYEKAWARARARVIAALDREYALLGDDLDRRAAHVGALLDQGPTKIGATELWKAGNLPAYAAVLWPEYGLDVGQLPPTQRQQAQKYLLEHPEVAEQLTQQRLEELRRRGLLPPGDPGAGYTAWIRNTVINGVSTHDVQKVIDRFHVTPAEMDKLAGLRRVTMGGTHQVTFQLPPGVSPADAKRLTFLTWVYNAGTGYAQTENPQYPPEPWNADEGQRILDRQNPNAWTYDRFVPRGQQAGTTFFTTPNGTLIASGGHIPLEELGIPADLVALMSQRGGTTYGDMFLVSPDEGESGEDAARNLIERGYERHLDRGGRPYRLELARILHHEEMHSRQWAKAGPEEFAALYLSLEALTGGGSKNPFEQGAGLYDGGYEPDP